MCWVCDPDATVCGAVPVAMMDTINTTARTKGKQGYECTYYLSRVTPDRYVTFDNNIPLSVLIH